MKQVASKGGSLDDVLAAMLACFAMGGALVSWWETTWQAAVNPTRGAIYRARIGPSDCLAPIKWWWKRQAGCRLI
jgi:hypothetical protein